MSSQLVSKASKLKLAMCCGPIKTAGAASSSQNALKHRGASQSADKFKQLQDNYLDTHDPNAPATPNATFRMRFYRPNPPSLQTKKLSILAHDNPPIGGPNLAPASQADR